VPDPAAESVAGSKGVLTLIVATGIATVVTQLLTIREFLTQLQGNEFVIALILFNWLVWGGLGTLAAHRLSRVFTPGRQGLMGLSLMLAALAPLHLMAIRLLPRWLFTAGTSVGFYPGFGYSFLASGPYSLMVGFVLVYSLLVIRRCDPAFPATRVYLADNAGDVAGAALFAFLLVYLATPFQALALAHVGLMIAVALLGRAIGAGGVAWLAAIGAVVVLGAGVATETASLRPLTGDLVLWRESPYGRLAVVKDAEQVTVFEDGVPAAFTHDRAGAEEAVHYALVQLDQVRRVLIIGAEAGMMAEAAKYRPEAVDWVEINPDSAELMQGFGLIEPIAGLNLILTDARRFLAKTPNRYDAIIVTVAEPATFQANRFFTDRFFQLARSHLSDQGVLGFSIRAVDNYISDTQRDKIAILRATAGRHFDQVRLIPGTRLYFICANRPVDTGIARRLAGRDIATDYLAGYFDGNVTAGRIAEVNAVMAAGTRPNTDFEPRLMRMVLAQWFEMFGATPWTFILGLSVVTLIYLLTLPRENFVLFSTGFGLMGCQILVIFAFQVFFGYIYLQIGMIVTAFLAGLFPGALMAGRIRIDARCGLILCDLALILLTAAFALGLSVAADHLPAWAYLAFGFAAAMVCGFQFPLVLGLGGDKDGSATRAFSADLMGAAAGTLVTSVALVPYSGLLGAAAGIIGLKCLSLLVMGVRRQG